MTAENPLPTLIVVSHPLAPHHLSILRDERTPRAGFRGALDSLSRILALSLPVAVTYESAKATTPVAAEYDARRITSNFIIIPILRAAVGMLEAFEDTFPNVKVAFLGMSRDENTLKPRFYYESFPPCTPRDVFIIIDPMLATGGSIVKAIARVEETWRENCPSAPEDGHPNLIVATIISAPEGVARIAEAHPWARVYTMALDERLNDKGYIVPGLGDAGDRLFF